MTFTTSTFFIVFFSLIACMSGQFFGANTCYSTVERKTSHGRVVGTMCKTSEGNKEYAAFIGIPYARPPLDERRFKDPETLNYGYGDVLTPRRVHCLQTGQRFRISMSVPQSEDCLYLNVFQRMTTDSRTALFSKPVLFYIHGGEFKYGGKDFFDPDFIFGKDKGDFVLVTINYRLGVFGFLNTDDEYSPGNYGIKDMIAALNWVRKEISNFGGNPDKITVFGHDSGAIAATILSLLTETRPMINNVIASGGTVYTPGAFEVDPRRVAEKFAESLDCSISSTKSLVKCLRWKVSNTTLAEHSIRGRIIESSVNSNSNGFGLNNLLTNNVAEWTFKPVLNESSYNRLIDKPLDILLESLPLIKGKYLLGLAEDEGTLEYYHRYGAIVSASTTQDKILELVKPHMNQFQNPMVVASLANYEYFVQRDRDSIPSQEEVEKRLKDISGKFLYVSPTVRFAQKLNSKLGGGTLASNLVSIYVTNRETRTGSFLNLQTTTAGRTPQPGFTASHMDDTFCLFKTDPYAGTEPGKTAQNLATEGCVNNMVNCLDNFLNDRDDKCNKRIDDGSSTGINRVRYAYISNGNFDERFWILQDEKIAFWNTLVANIIKETTVVPPYFPYDSYGNFKAATWTLTSLLVLFLIATAALAFFVFYKHRQESLSLKLWKSREQELQERGESSTEKL